MHDILKQIGDLGIVPVAKIDQVKDAVPLAQALADGGLPVIEITFRTDAAEESIRAITTTLPNVLVGAGTVLNVDQAKRAIQAGAKFIVTPGFSASVVKYCVDNNIPITAGIATPTEIVMALDFGLNVVKFFPADAFGGLKTLKAMSAPLGNVLFMPTGGITTDNLAEYISFPEVLACGGTWMVKEELIKGDKFAEITKITQDAIQTMLGFSLGHVGINTPDADTALDLSKSLAGMFSLPLLEGNSSNFVSKGIEVNKGKGLGANGHIAVQTNTITRAVAWLERKGVGVDMRSAKKDAAGNLVAVYLKGGFGGFAVHLLQKE